MDQIVFVFDLEQLVPLDSVTQIDDSSLDLKLDVIKQAALSITTCCSEAGKLLDSRRDLPSFGFKYIFYKLISIIVIILSLGVAVPQNIFLYQLDCLGIGMTSLESWKRLRIIWLK